MTEPLVFSVFDHKQRSTTDITKESASFLWFEMLVSILRCMRCDSSVLEEMLNKCELFYKDNLSQMVVLQRFRETYIHNNNAIEWYVNESCIYFPLNRALRTEDIDALITFRFYLIDLCQQLEHEHRLQYRQHDQHTQTITVYRGQQLSLEERERLQYNIGNLILINGFFSTTLDREVAKMYASETREAVLFRIEVSTSLETAVFAYIGNYGRFRDEKEVLFSIGTVFQVKNVYLDHARSGDIWTIDLVATDEGREILDQYIALLKEDLVHTKPDLLFGRLLIDMQEYSKANIYFNSLLSREEQRSDIFRVYENIGRCQTFLGQYKDALNTFALAEAYCNEDWYFGRIEYLTANVYVFQGQNDLAMNTYENALDHFKKAFQDHSHQFIAQTLSGIGWVYDRKEQIDKALSYYWEAHKHRLLCLPLNHMQFATSFIAISGLLQKQHKYCEALDYLEKAFEIRRKILPEISQSMAESIACLACLYHDTGDLKKALKFHLRALDIRQKCAAENLNLTAGSLRLIGNVYESENKYHLPKIIL